MSDLQLTRAELMRRRRFARDAERFEATDRARAIEQRARRGIRARQRAPHGRGRTTR